MKTQTTLTSARLRAPRAAAIAGIVFSVLLITSFLLLRRSVPSNPLEAGAWLQTRANVVALALNLLPFAGIAFLWFIGVLRDRLSNTYGISLFQHPIVKRRFVRPQRDETAET